MKKSVLTLSALLAAATFTACVDADTGTSSGRIIIDQTCAADTDCPTGFECEIETEHGVTTSYCQSDEDSDGTCPAGFELEVEHGQAHCKPHGGDGDGGNSGSDSGPGHDDTDDTGDTDDDDGGTGTGTGITGATCATDADCVAGLECEVEVEHGTTTATCQPHGGH